MEYEHNGNNTGHVLDAFGRIATWAHGLSHFVIHSEGDQEALPLLLIEEEILKECATIKAARRTHARPTVDILDTLDRIATWTRGLSHLALTMEGHRLDGLLAVCMGDQIIQACTASSARVREGTFFAQDAVDTDLQDE